MPLLVLPLLLCLAAAFSPFYDVPQPMIEALKPRGLRISIPDDLGVELFAVHANLNKPISPLEAGQISVDITRPKGSRWVYEDRRVRLKPGDVINYWLYVQVDGQGYRLDDQTFVVKELVEPGSGKLQMCEPTITTVNGKPTCKGQLIFEESFSIFNQSKWQYAIQLAGRPDYQFVLYTENPENSVVRDDKLVITPTLLSPDDSDYIYYGHISVPRCTGLPNSAECDKTAAAWSILPPVQSAKLHTKYSFSFAYGVIEIRAKLPMGDWIFPEIWLEPKENYYGHLNYQSGQIRIAMARGNEDLTKDGAQLGNTLLEAGCRLGLKTKIRNEMYTKSNWTPFGSDFHVYRVIWDKDQLVFVVDGMEIGRVRPPLGGFSGLQEFASSPTVPWKSKLAPFDREFYITLGVGVGGHLEFPDGCLSHKHPKPWRNRETKSILRFYKDLDNWYPTWDSQKSALEVDYVKVWAV
ncbi:beta-1,3-glucan-binding protein-like [Schistocerca piceifrons]|uniref:beta-1,3-glucan-binding protein-like n=1 Tax=Schistocerca piceifrons TaxID=274613 RepID=UPI001F5E55FC|nr:beta-1,3-glucan-binding protein-like [Schistocerca piceifrons]XP_049958595.1 beta-1,3-glucan-binding protein-like [Schistocerca serialis cubense]